MQNTDRMKLLEQMMLEHPDDPFPPYALALEWAALPGNDSKAIQLLNALKQKQPDYLPLYYQLGHLLSRSGETDSARKVMCEGIDLAIQQKNRHAQAELESYLDNIDEG